MKHQVIPFFVVDRPASLLILKGIFLKYSNIKVGLMSHAFVSKNFQNIFKEFPYNIPLLYEDETLNKNEDILAEHLIKMCDSGVFSKNGCYIDYEELFNIYEKMSVDYGIMIDALRDSRATIESAERALRAYNKRKYRFKLVAVAQGREIDEYLECYAKLQSNFEYIAVGGLLKKIENSARYVRIRDEVLLYKVLYSIKKEFSPNWIFALGCYHPSRHKKFEELGVWGSDYKGWIFNYDRKERILSDIHNFLLSFELSTNKIDRRFKDICREIAKIEKRMLKIRINHRKNKNILPQKEENLLIKDLINLHEKLLEKRLAIAEQNHLPEEYKEKLNELINIIHKNEQELRFKQVRSYIEEYVYAQLL